MSRLSPHAMPPFQAYKALEAVRVQQQDPHHWNHGYVSTNELHAACSCCRELLPVWVHDAVFSQLTTSRIYPKYTIHLNPRCKECAATGRTRWNEPDPQTEYIDY